MYTVEVKFTTSLPRHFEAALAGGLLVGVGLLVYIYSPLPDVVVTRTATGFSPSKITIHKGQAVVFKSATGKDFWPASDFHPTHTMYPEFDPKHPLKATESWRFVFTKAGVWTFHDHLSEYMRGTVIVVGAPGESSKECLLHVATSSPSAAAECWSVDITETLQKKGLSAAFDMYASLYAENPSFRGLSCHDAGHILGSAAYKEYEDNHKVIDRPETSYCGFGFYHGFMEAMIADQGPAQYQKVRDYCDALKTNGQLNGPSGSCYHGIGHAALDSLSGDTWGNDVQMTRDAIDVCELIVVGTPERAVCADGVFNALAIAKSRHSYNLSFDVSDPTHLCPVQKKEYQSPCYRELGISVIREQKMDRTAAVRFIRSYGNADAVAASISGYMGDEVARAIVSINLSSFYTFCQSFSSAQNRLACHEGVLLGLNQAGEPGHEYVQMFRYCALYPIGSARTRCNVLTVLQKRRTSSDPAAFQAACLATGDPEVTARCK
jgi:plastocyanin